ncbi:MAG: sigma 54-interacting transcriptional regulator [Candidatus Accumulibacter sp.]|nr:sigma 54-interacting transcriptional regulator [Candidatus Accumulibacter propinquus]
MRRFTITGGVWFRKGTGARRCIAMIHCAKPGHTLPISRWRSRDLRIGALRPRALGAFSPAPLATGAFRTGRGGTLFLDEIGDVPAELRTRLLRVLSDDHYFLALGGHSPLKTGSRIIAATHQDLEARVSQGLFREEI